MSRPSHRPNELSWTAWPLTPIPAHKALADIYTPASLPAQEKRWAALASSFEVAYSRPLQKVVRAAGRVNIIGEHIDYSGFSVLPAAIERDTLVAVAVSDEDSTTGKTTFHLGNTDAKYGPTSFEADLASDGQASLPMPAKHTWSSYFIAGTKGILGHLHSHSLAPQRVPAEVWLFITGSVPAGSGLSSSSAMTTASATTVLEICGQRSNVGRRDLTNVAIVSERLVGVNSGGMDQSASVFSQPSHLLHITFNPLQADPVPLDPSVTFVIANTLVTSDKQTSAAYCYNLRVAETRLGAKLFGAKSGCYADLVEGAADPVEKLTELMEMVEKEDKLGPEEGLTWDEVAKLLGEDRDELEKKITDGMVVTPPQGKLKIKPRARHVFAEARRVYLFKKLLGSSLSGSGDELLSKLGGLMNDSMASCQGDYECSCPELDELTDLARANGAFGSRVTGAGWGGATVSLVREGDVDSFITALRTGYYAKRFPNLTESELADVCFSTKPEAGACVFLATATATA